MRETKTVRAPQFPGTRNRDLGRTFIITEWPAARADDWGMRMVLAANRGGGSIPMDVRSIGMEGIAILGVNTFLRGNIAPTELIPLWNELLECVKIVRDEKAPHILSDLLDDDIQEVATRQWLRLEVLSLHINFSATDAISALVRSILTKVPPSADSSSASTSPPE